MGKSNASIEKAGLNIEFGENVGRMARVVAASSRHQSHVLLRPLGYSFSTGPPLTQISLKLFLAGIQTQFVAS